MARTRVIKWGLGIALCGILAGVIPTMAAMIKAFQSVTPGTQVDPEAVTEDVRASIRWSYFTTPIVGTGLVVVVIGAAMKRRRHPEGNE